MKFTAYAKCPYCEKENYVKEYTDNNGYNPHHIAVYCESEEGGCDELFLVHIPYRITLESIPVKPKDEAD